MGKATDVSKEVGKRISALRKSKNIKQDELAAKAKINRAYMGYIERGERNPSTDTLDRIAKALGIPLHELFKE